MDLPVYAEAAVQGVPLLFVVSGLVMFWGKLGLTGKAQLVSALLTGLGVGVVYMVMTVAPASGGFLPVFTYWASNVFYGLGLGLVAVGIYEANKAAAAKGQEKAIQKIEAEAYRGQAPKME